MDGGRGDRPDDRTDPEVPVPAYTATTAHRPAQALDEVLRAAQQLGWAVRSTEDGKPPILVRGVTPWSWGARIAVRVAPLGAGSILTFVPSETWAVTDWGRNRRAVRAILLAVGADLDLGGRS